METHETSGRMVVVINGHTFVCVKGLYMELSLRARTYLWSCFVANLIMGLALVVIPQAFLSQSFDALQAVAPLRAWGGVFLISAVMTLWGAYKGTERPARWALMSNLVPTGGFFAGFLVAVIQGTSASPSGVVAWGLLTVINCIMLANPLRTPFEDLVKEITEAGE